MATTDTHICALCDSTGLERTRFFQRQLVTAPDLTQDQAYFLEKSRRHNRLLHGWGVVCGAHCRLGPGDCEVVIEPGYILGPYGDEIVIDREVTINACTQDLDGNVAGPCGQPADPWCSNVRIDRRAGDKLYLAVRYAECHDRPVRVMSAGCGCDPMECEYSRIRDSTVFRVLARLPSTYPDPMPEPDPRALLSCSEQGRPCPPCPAEPWVILADVTLAGDGKIARLDCFAHRRHVVSLADFYFMCKPMAVAPPAPEVRSVRILGWNRAIDPVRLGDPPVRLRVSAQLEPSIIEVVFGNADIDATTVVSGKSFRVERLDGGPARLLMGAVDSNGPQDTVRWQLEGGGAMEQGAYRVTLAGTGQDVIRSIQGVALNGDTAQPPSGDEMQGSDFVFQFDVFMPG